MTAGRAGPPDPPSFCTHYVAWFPFLYSGPFVDLVVPYFINHTLGGSGGPALPA